MRQALFLIGYALQEEQRALESENADAAREMNFVQRARQVASEQTLSLFEMLEKLHTENKLAHEAQRPLLSWVIQVRCA